MKILNLLLSLVFIVFGVVQFNDPDALLWMSIYFATATFGIFAAFRKFQPLALKTALILSFAGLIFLSPLVYHAFIHYDKNLLPDPTITHTANIQTEIFKEFFGLFIVTIALLFWNWQAKKNT